jgi:mono/diheme cytochrome c family protein
MRPAGCWLGGNAARGLLSHAAPGTGGSACPGAEVFATHCAVCHGPKAEGMPGSFPPLGAQIQSFAQSPRDAITWSWSCPLG